MKKIDQFEILRELINQELVDANEKYPLFNSEHEAWAITTEEVQEAQDEINLIQNNMEMIWKNIRMTKDKDILEKNLINSYCRIRERAINAIEELIQVAAMCDKALISMEDENVEDK